MPRSNSKNAIITAVATGKTTSRRPILPGLLLTAAISALVLTPIIWAASLPPRITNSGGITIISSHQAAWKIETAFAAGTLALAAILLVLNRPRNARPVVGVSGVIVAAVLALAAFGSAQSRVAIGKDSLDAPLKTLLSIPGFRREVRLEQVKRIILVDRGSRRSGETFERIELDSGEVVDFDFGGVQIPARKELARVAGERGIKVITVSN